MAVEPGDRARDEDATTGGGATADRGQRDAGPPGPDPGEVASRPGTGGRSRSADDNQVRQGGTPDEPAKSGSN